MSPLYFEEVHYICYNNLNKLQIILLYVLFNIAILLGDIRNIFFFNFIKPLNYKNIYKENKS